MNVRYEGDVMSDYMLQHKRNLKAAESCGRGTPKPGEVWWVSNLDGIKDRPVLVLGHSSNNIRFRKCTSKSSAEFHRDLIEDYYEAGLDKSTFVDREVRVIDRNRLVRKMGSLSDYDREKFGF